jgi:hypothetical protein
MERRGDAQSKMRMGLASSSTGIANINSALFMSRGLCPLQVDVLGQVQARPRSPTEGLQGFIVSEINSEFDCAGKRIL